jgi:hypothetical protein
LEPIESFCALASIAAGEPLYGTAASHTDAWLVLEHAGAWGKKAWEEADIPSDVRAHVDAWVHSEAGARIQLIKRDDTRTRGDLHLYLASSRQAKPCVAELRLPELAALRDVDLAAAIAALRTGDLPPGARSPARPLALVCTNGKRDRCCAKWGVPVFDAIRGRTDVDVWQTTHLGGHRFAATMLWLPEGLCYGRISVGEVAGIVDAALARRIDPLDRLRGRTSLGEAGQAAEYLLRRDHDAHGFDDVEVIAERDDEGRRRIDARVRGTAATILLASEPTGTSAPGSCGKPAEPIERWTAVG